MDALPEKKCFKCGEVKILSAFYKHPKMADGHVNKCKECNKKDVHKNREDNLEYVQDYDRNRRKKCNVTEKRWEELSEKQRVWQEGYYSDNPEKLKAKQEAAWKENVGSLEWEKLLARSRKSNCSEVRWEERLAAGRKYSEDYPERNLASTRKYRDKNPKKYKAHSAVGYAIKVGKMFPEPCKVCNSLDVHGHHCDYDKPLDVLWLCAEHHAAWHTENGEGLNAHTETQQ